MVSPQPPLPESALMLTIPTETLKTIINRRGYTHADLGTPRLYLQRLAWNALSEIGGIHALDLPRNLTDIIESSREKMAPNELLHAVLDLELNGSILRNNPKGNDLRPRWHAAMFDVLNVWIEENADKLDRSPSLRREVQKLIDWPHRSPLALMVMLPGRRTDATAAVLIDAIEAAARLH